jgi:hypothetical protein
VGELPGLGRYERRGQGPPVVILSNPQADPALWAQPFTSALVGAGQRCCCWPATRRSSSAMTATPGN